uniref:Uncharacterized protein n=1 Tax=Anguilla anguilla TaxID=7936 RepID=A0A0E9QWD7_ANGAN
MKHSLLSPQAEIMTIRNQIHTQYSM